MKTSRLTITVDIDHESVNEETFIVTAIRRHLVSSLEDNLYLLTRDGGASDIGGWAVRVKTEDLSKEAIQTNAERITPFAHINAYFSSDGPAFVAQLNTHFDSKAEYQIIELTLSDINATLREAYHKYLIKINEDR